MEVQLDIEASGESLQAGIIPVQDALIIAKNIFLLKGMFELCTFTFVHKSFNRASTMFASFAHENMRSQSWKASFPLWLQDVAIQDLRPVGQIGCIVPSSGDGREGYEALEVKE